MPTSHSYTKVALVGWGATVGEFVATNTQTPIWDGPRVQSWDVDPDPSKEVARFLMKQGPGVAPNQSAAGTLVVLGPEAVKNPAFVERISRIRKLGAELAIEHQPFRTGATLTEFAEWLVTGSWPEAGDTSDDILDDLFADDVDRVDVDPNQPNPLAADDSEVPSLASPSVVETSTLPDDAPIALRSEPEPTNDGPVILARPESREDEPVLPIGIVDAPVETSEPLEMPVFTLPEDSAATMAEKETTETPNAQVSIPLPTFSLGDEDQGNDPLEEDTQPGTSPDIELPTISDHNKSAIFRTHVAPPLEPQPQAPSPSSVSEDISFPVLEPSARENATTDESDAPDINGLLDSLTAGSPNKVGNTTPASPNISSPIKDTGVIQTGGSVNEPTSPSPIEPPQFLQSMSPQDQQATISTREMLSTLGVSPASAAVTSGEANSSVMFYFTGSHGGAGKSTVSWVAANCIQMAIRSAHDPAYGGDGGHMPPVFLFEADYRNPKLQQRLDIPRQNDFGLYASFLREYGKRSGEITPQRYKAVVREIFERIIIRRKNGLNVVVCPYDLTNIDPKYLTFAINKMTEWAREQGGYIVFDSGTATTLDPLDRALAGMSDHIVVITDHGHREDMMRAGTMSITPETQMGFGKQLNQVHIFLNRTGHEQALSFIHNTDEGAAHFSVQGYMPEYPELTNSWIGQLGTNDVARLTILQVTRFLRKVHPIPEIGKDPDIQAQPSPQGGVRSVFHRLGARRTRSKG